MTQHIVDHENGEEEDITLSQVTGGLSKAVRFGSAIGVGVGFGPGIGVSMHKMNNETNKAKYTGVVVGSSIGGMVGGAAVGGGVAKAGKYIASRARQVTVHPTGDNV